MSPLLIQPQAFMLTGEELGSLKLEQRTEAECLVRCFLAGSGMMLSMFLWQCEWALCWR